MTLPDFPFVVLDTETTGFVPKVHRIIEFASMRVRNGQMEDEYEQLLSIDAEIPPHVQVLTRIKPDALDGQPSMEECRARIEEHIGPDTMIVGQNVGFDIGMLKGEGIDLSDRPWIDTSMLASLVYPESDSYSLGYISSFLNLPHEPVHRALGDVRATLSLLSKCWERLQELSPEEYAAIAERLERMPEGYKTFFGALPEAKNSENPAWLKAPPSGHMRPSSPSAQAFEPTTAGTVQLLEEPLDPGFLGGLLDTLTADNRHVHWLAVKNLHATLRSVDLPEGVRVLEAPIDFLDPAAAEQLLNQSEYTADETTLALKLAWYKPTTARDLPLHGNEKSIWNGKLAGGTDATPYAEQFNGTPSVYLLNHWHLLTILHEAEHPARAFLNEQSHILIDDASMLEDTATRAYGLYCAIDDLRAAAEGDDELTRFTDLLTLWVEKTRNNQDVRYLVLPDLQSAEARGLSEQLAALQERESAKPAQPFHRHLEALAGLLDVEQLSGRIVWIEQNQRGSLILQSVPEAVGSFLQEHLYSVYPTSLLIPPGSGNTLTEILPHGPETEIAESPGESDKGSLEFPEAIRMKDVMEEPPAGKTVLLLTSRGRIEEQYVRYAEALEAKGVTLICQGMSGGKSRMQAEFAISEGQTLWLLTPWTFESVDLPPESIDHLILESLPFDHPSHTVLSRRAERYQDAFVQYSLPRLQHRLYRLLRTFCRYRRPGGDALFLDQRLRTKRYGSILLRYLTSLAGPSQSEETDSGTEDQLRMF